MYPDDAVSTFVSKHFIPVRAHVKTDQPTFERFNAQWTPTIVVLDQKGTEQHRIEGFLPVPDFLAQLRLGVAHAARARNDWPTAQKMYDELAGQSDQQDIAAEASYWSGVSQYKSSGDASALGTTATKLRDKFPDSTWAKKASVWLG